MADRAELFDALKSHLAANGEEAIPYAEISARVQRPITTLRKDVERLRRRYGEILREEALATISDPADADEELRYLCQALTYE